MNFKQNLKSKWNEFENRTRLPGTYLDTSVKRTKFTLWSGIVVHLLTSRPSLASVYNCVKGHKAARRWTNPFLFFQSLKLWPTWSSNFCPFSVISTTGHPRLESLFQNQIRLWDLIVLCITRSYLASVFLVIQWLLLRDILARFCVPLGYGKRI